MQFKNVEYQWLLDKAHLHLCSIRDLPKRKICAAFHATGRGQRCNTAIGYSPPFSGGEGIHGIVCLVR